MESQDKNIILNIVEEINREIREDIEDDADEFCLDFISDGFHSTISFLGILLWDEDDLFNEAWINDWGTHEFQQALISLIWGKILNIKGIIYKLTQHRERKFHFKPSA